MILEIVNHIIKSYQIQIVAIFEFKDRNDMETDQGPDRSYMERHQTIFFIQ